MEVHHQRPKSCFRLPSSNQTWQWEIAYKYIITCLSGNITYTYHHYPFVYGRFSMIFHCQGWWPKGILAQVTAAKEGRGSPWHPSFHYLSLPQKTRRKLDVTLSKLSIGMLTVVNFDTHICFSHFFNDPPTDPSNPPPIFQDTTTSTSAAPLPPGPAASPPTRAASRRRAGPGSRWRWRGRRP